MRTILKLKAFGGILIDPSTIIKINIKKNQKRGIAVGDRVVLVDHHGNKYESELVYSTVGLGREIRDELLSELKKYIDTEIEIVEI